MVEMMVSLILNFKLVIMLNGGYYYMIDNLDVYYKYLVDFICQVEVGIFNK